jgi:DNA-binding XRE family transcriptional regulator
MFKLLTYAKVPLSSLRHDTWMSSQGRSSSELYRFVGKRIRAVRKTRKLSQERLAKLIGLTRTSVTNIEGGRQKLLLHTLVEIAEQLCVPAVDLLPSETNELKLPSGVPPSVERWIGSVVKTKSTAANK